MIPEPQGDRSQLLKALEKLEELKRRARGMIPASVRLKGRKRFDRRAFAGRQFTVWRGAAKACGGCGGKLRPNNSDQLVFYCSRLCRRIARHGSRKFGKWSRRLRREIAAS